MGKDVNKNLHINTELTTADIKWLIKTYRYIFKNTMDVRKYDEHKDLFNALAFQETGRTWSEMLQILKNEFPEPAQPKKN